MKNNLIEKKIDEILKYIQVVSEQPLSVDEVCKLTKLQKSTIYKLTSKSEIPYHKLPGGKRLIFKKSEVMNWMFDGNRSVSDSKANSEN